MSIVVISGATIEVFHEVSSLAHWYSVEHVKPEEGMSFGLVGMCVSVLADMYPTHFTPVHGMYWSVVSIKVDQAKEKELNIQVRKFPHSWLAMREYSQVIIDVLPVDGTFGVSCPQAVVHNESSVRFFEAKGIYSVDLSQEDIATVNGKIIKVVELLTSCMEKIPF